MDPEPDPQPYRPHRRFRPRCLFLGMIFGWVVAIYVPSALIAAFGFSPPGTPPGILAATWHMTDEIGPFAKLTFAALAAAFFLGTRLAPMPRIARAAADAALGMLAMFLLLAFLPEAWSRGIGIGLTGQRFDPSLLPLYLLGGALAGLTFSLADAKCGELRHSEPS